MARPGFAIQTAGASTCSAATKRTLLVANSTVDSFDITEIGVGFDATSSTGGQVFVELAQLTNATTGVVTAQTPVQIRGINYVTPLSSGRINYTTEPTAFLLGRNWLVPMNGGLVIQFPLGREPGTIASTSGGSYALSVTAPSTVGCRAYMEFEI